VLLEIGILSPMLEISCVSIGFGILAVALERETCGMVTGLNDVHVPRLEPMGVMVGLGTLVVMLE
jgi:hypothetical protein